MFVFFFEFEIIDFVVFVFFVVRFWCGIGFMGVKFWFIVMLEVFVDSEIFVEVVCLWDENDFVFLIDIDLLYG